MTQNVITREAAVARIRRELMAMQEDGKSVCQIAAERKILCRGFHRDSPEELRWRYAEQIDGAVMLSRLELEERANSWQLERQNNEKARLCCDVQYMFYETCRAWDDFTNEQLARFCFELSGDHIRVAGKKELVVL